MTGLIFLMTDNDRSLMTEMLVYHLYLSLFSLEGYFTRFRKTEFKLPENYCILQHFFVPLHQQSKESFSCTESQSS